MDEATIKARRERLSAMTKEKLDKEKAKLEEMLVPFKARLPSQEVLDAIQYRHDAYYGRTYAIIAPEPEDLLSATKALFNGEPNPKVNFKIGVSRLNPEDRDQYNKYIGRTISASNLAQRLLTVLAVHVDKKEVCYVTEMDGLQFTFTLTHTRVKPFLRDIWDNNRQASYSERVKASKKI